jgi:hypothetical protein
VDEILHIPDEFKTAALCAAAVRRHWTFLEFVHHAFMAAGALLAEVAPQGILASAVRQYATGVIQAIPEQFRYVDLCRSPSNSTASVGRTSPRRFLTA